MSDHPISERHQFLNNLSSDQINPHARIFSQFLGTRLPIEVENMIGCKSATNSVRYVCSRHSHVENVNDPRNSIKLENVWRGVEMMDGTFQKTSGYSRRILKESDTFGDIIKMMHTDGLKVVNGHFICYEQMFFDIMNKSPKNREDTRGCLLASFGLHDGLARLQIFDETGVANSQNCGTILVDLISNKVLTAATDRHYSGLTTGSRPSFIAAVDAMFRGDEIVGKCHARANIQKWW